VSTRRIAVRIAVATAAAVFVFSLDALGFPLQSWLTTRHALVLLAALLSTLLALVPPPRDDAAPMTDAAACGLAVVPLLTLAGMVSGRSPAVVAAACGIVLASALVGARAASLPPGLARTARFALVAWWLFPPILAHLGRVQGRDPLGLERWSPVGFLAALPAVVAATADPAPLGEGTARVEVRSRTGGLASPTAFALVEGVLEGGERGFARARLGGRGVDTVELERPVKAGDRLPVRVALPTRERPTRAELRAPGARAAIELLAGEEARVAAIHAVPAAFEPLVQGVLAGLGGPWTRCPLDDGLPRGSDALATADLIVAGPEPSPAVMEAVHAGIPALLVGEPPPGFGPGGGRVRAAGPGHASAVLAELPDAPIAQVVSALREARAGPRLPAWLPEDPAFGLRGAFGFEGETTRALVGIALLLGVAPSLVLVTIARRSRRGSLAGLVAVAVLSVGVLALARPVPPAVSFLEGAVVIVDPDGAATRIERRRAYAARGTLLRLVVPGGSLAREVGEGGRLRVRDDASARRFEGWLDASGAAVLEIRTATRTGSVRSPERAPRNPLSTVLHDVRRLGAEGWMRLGDVAAGAALPSGPAARGGSAPPPGGEWVERVYERVERFRPQLADREILIGYTGPTASPVRPGWSLGTRREPTVWVFRL